MKVKNSKEIKLSSVDNSVEKVRQAISAASKDLGKSPHEVTKREILNYTSCHSIDTAGGIGRVKAAFFPITEKDLKGIQESNNVKSYIGSLEKSVGSKLIHDEAFIKAISNIPKVNLTPYKAKAKQKTNRILNLVISDTHFGSNLKKEETGGLDYGTLEEARRLAKVVKDTCDYKKQYRSETKLNIMLLGDLINGSLHDARDGAPLAEQICRTIFLLNQAIAQFAASFPDVEVHCATGNHGRNKSRHHNRAVNQKWDSNETIIYYAIKEANKHLKNVKINIPKTPFSVVEVFGKKMLATHGDTVFNAGYPGSSINTKQIETQINKFNATLSDKDEYAVTIIGHVHIGSVTHLSNGTVSITNGATIPSDEYAVSIGMMENQCGQYLFESTPGFPVGDTRFIKVSSSDDEDISLDKIIKPWENL